MHRRSLLLAALLITSCSADPAGPGSDPLSGAMPTDVPHVELLVDGSGLHHIVATDRASAAWGEGCSDARTAGPFVLAMSLLVTGHASEDLGEEVMHSGVLAVLMPRTLPFDPDTGLVDPDRTATLADVDRTMWVLGIPEGVEEQLAALSDSDRAVLDRFTEGFNTCYAGKATAWRQQYPWVATLEGVPLRPEHVLSRLEYFWSGWDVVPMNDAIQAAQEAPGTDPADLPAERQDYDGMSNQWVLSGSLMEDGRIVHATDPHIPLSIAGPYGMSFRHVVGRFIGGALVGTPGIILGATTSAEGNAAWSMTATGPDTLDIFEVHADDAAGTYVTSDGETLPVATRTVSIGGRGFPIRDTRYGRLFFRDPVRETFLARRSSSERPLRTFEWIQRMNEATSMADLERAMADEDGNPWGLVGLNLMAASNRRSADDPSEAFLYVLYGRVPRRAGDSDLDRRYGGVRDSLDPLNEWTGGFYPLAAMPRTTDLGDGYRANCNVSPAVTDGAIGTEFPEAIVFDRQHLLTTYRQESFTRRAAELAEQGPASTDRLLAFAGDTRDLHWDAMARVMVETFVQHGDPLGLVHDGDADLPPAYQVMADIASMAAGDGVRAEPDSRVAAFMHMFERRLLAHAKAAGDRDATLFASAGRPMSFEALDGESARLAFQELVDTYDYVVGTYPVPPAMRDIIRHCYLDGAGGVACDGTYGSGGSFRNLGGPDITGPEGGPWLSVLDGGHAFLMLSRLGAPGDVTVHLLKPYTTGDALDALGPVMPRRLARGELTTIEARAGAIHPVRRDAWDLP